MKICKNNSDIILHPDTKCSKCVFRRLTRPCLWVKIIGMPLSLDCGGIKADILSDIFRL